MFLFFLAILIIIGRRDKMDFTKLNENLAAINATIAGLPAAIAALNTDAQGKIDAAAAQVDSANTAIIKAVTPDS